MKSVTSIVIAVLIIAGAFFAYQSLSKPSPPQVREDGGINGEYSLASIMALRMPYRCTFEKSDQSTGILGIIHTDGQGVYGEFRIMTDNPDIREFNDFLLVKDGKAYTWTSLGNIGYVSDPATSASVNASPEEQAQIIGANDKVHYDCKPWQDVDATIFEQPSFIQFVSL